MKRKIIGLMIIVTFLVLAVESVAAAPFLCPVVGDGKDGTKGVINASEQNSKNGNPNGVSAITPPVGTSQIPGKNQAGDHANPNAYNIDGPGNPDAGPGHNPDFSPIWLF